MNMNIGPIFSLIRKANEKKMIDISDNDEFKMPKISDFENGKRELPDEQIRELYQRIEVPYVKDESIIDTVNVGLFEIMHDISFGNGGEVDVLDSLSEKLPYIWCSPIYITWLLCEFVIHIYHSNGRYKCDKDIEILSSHSDYLTDYGKQVLYDTVGVYYKDICEYDRALTYFDLAICHTASDSIQALAYYHKIMILNGRGKLVQSFEYIKKAKKLFDAELNLRRSVMVSMLLAVNYNLQGFYEKAEQIYFQILESIKLIPFSNEIKVYNNLIWNYILWRKYDQALEYCKIALEMDHEYANVYLYQTLALWECNEIEKARETLKKAQEYKEKACKFDQSLIKAVASMLYNRPFEQQEKRLLETYEVAQDVHDHQLQTYTLEFLSEISRQANNMEKENYYLKLVIKKLKERH